MGWNAQLTEIYFIGWFFFFEWACYCCEFQFCCLHIVLFRHERPLFVFMCSAKEVDDAIEKFLVEFNETMQQMTMKEFENLVSKFFDIA